jgi:hypothetical protein
MTTPTREELDAIRARHEAGYRTRFINFKQTTADIATLLSALDTAHDDALEEAVQRCENLLVDRPNETAAFVAAIRALKTGNKGDGG